MGDAHGSVSGVVRQQQKQGGAKSNKEMEETRDPEDGQVAKQGNGR